MSKVNPVYGSVKKLAQPHTICVSLLFRVLSKFSFSKAITEFRF